MIRCLNCMKEFDEAFGVCPNCGHIPSVGAKEAYQLCQGVILAGRYVIGTALGVGGFGITYRAWDNTLQKMIAIKEYYPSANGIVNRTPGKSEVIIYSGERAVEFHKGKERFLAEARNMAKFNTHPNIVHVFDFFEENDTAYIAMEFLDGVSYKQFIASNGGHVPQELSVEVTLSVLDALKEIHKSGIIHRDISPDNVFICQGGIIKLIDFGAARFSTGEEEKTLSIILKPGYAPPEQYRSRSRQGPWTDIYAVGAMLYRAITGKMPDESVNRMVKDNVAPPHEINPEISENLSNAIMRSIALNQELRFKNVDQFREAIQNKSKVLDVGTELKRRKRFRIAASGIVFAVLIVAAGACLTAFRIKRAEVTLADASIVVWYPAVEDTAGIWGNDTTGEAQDKGGFMEMVKTYEKYYPNVDIKIEAIPQDQYEERLKTALLKGSAPAVFDSTCLLNGYEEDMASLDEAYAWLKDKKELNKYYFLNQYTQYFPEEKQMPMSFQIPVIYTDKLLAEDAPLKVQRTDELGDILGSKAGYGLDPTAKPAFVRLAPSVGETYDYQDFVVDLNQEAGESGQDFDAEAQKTQMLKGKVGYYLSDTSKYQRIQNDMAGIYRVILMEDMPLEGRFTNLWSVYSKAPRAEQKAGVRLIYFLLSKENQQILNLQHDNGLPLHREVFDEYKAMNTEFSDIGQCIGQVIMNNATN